MIKSAKLENGKEYRLFTSRMEVEVKTSRIHAETSYPIWMRVNGARVVSQVIAAIVDADHTEALDMNAAIEWAKITPEQRAIHDDRVTYGISLKNKYNTDDVLEACHAEALNMNTKRKAIRSGEWVYELISQEIEEATGINAAFDNSFHRRAANWGGMDSMSKWIEIEKAHAEALEMNRLFNMRAASGDRPQRMAKETGFPVLTCLKELIAEEGDYFTALERLRQIVSDAHSEALNMDAARELNARQARFVFHNTEAERAEAIEAAHAAALKIDANMKI